MQDYISLRVDTIPCNETITDLIAAFLADAGFDSFEPDIKGITAYVQKNLYDPAEVKQILDNFPISINYDLKTEIIKGKDWNEEWEKNYFQPILVDNKCVIHSSFHKDIPKAEYDIVIDPKMAFGTGHHATTSNMIRLILGSDIKDKKIIDMGTGTGILAILSKMMGADSVIGIEIDPDAYANAYDNANLNNCDINLICGDASSLKNIPEPSDYFLANINRNIILEDLRHYSSCLKEGGRMFLSGFYYEDIPLILQEARKYSLEYENHLIENNWVAVALRKV